MRTPSPSPCCSAERSATTGCLGTRAARALYTHRNTVLNRLRRAERLLPLPLAGNGVDVGAALEIAQWLGTQPEPGSATRASDMRAP